MKFIQIYKLENDGSQKVFLTCKLVDGVLVLEPENSLMMKEFEEKGIKDFESKTTLFPKDGEKFLEKLKYHFKSAYLNATDVQEN